MEHEDAVEALNQYQTIFSEEYFKLMRVKLGLERTQPEDSQLISALLEILQESRVDYTRFFRRLCDFKTDINEKNVLLQGMFIDPASFDKWAKIYRGRLEKEKSINAKRQERMILVNPKFILRNHIAQATIEKAQAGDYTEVDTLLGVLQEPFKEQPGMEHFAEPPAEGSRRISVSCSS